MAKIRFDDIEIVEPPLQELSKKPSFIKSGCLGGCGCFVLLIIITIAGWRLFLGPGPSTDARIPTNFPTSIPLYDREAVEQVTIISGKYKQRREKLATTIPQILMNPFESSTSTSSTAELLNSLWQNFVSPPTAQDEITIEWQSRGIETKFITNYYQQELTQNGYTIVVDKTNTGMEKINFKNDNEGISGVMIAESLSSESGLGTYVTMTIFITSGL